MRFLEGTNLLDKFMQKLSTLWTTMPSSICNTTGCSKTWAIKFYCFRDWIQCIQNLFQTRLTLSCDNEIRWISM